MTFPVPTDPNSPTRTLQIESTQLIPHVLPTLAVGDVLKVTVRQNPQDGTGLIYFKGLLVKAKLPPNVEPGDKLLAQLTERDDQVVLKILEQTKTEFLKPLIPAQTPLPELMRDIEELFKDLAPQSARAGGVPLSLTETIKRAGIVEKVVQNLISTIPDSNKLVDAKAALSQLLNATEGGTADSLKQAADSIRLLVQRHSPNEKTRELFALRDTLTALLETTVELNLDTAELLRRLPAPSQLTVKEQIKRAEREFIKQNAQLPSPSEDLPSTPQTTLRSLLTELQRELSLSQNQGILDPKTADDLLKLAGRFDQMANTQETLAKLNPVMQSLGEPALILFPFIFQGLFTHSEITVEARPKVDEEGEEGKNGKGKRGAFQRIQVSVPLPSLGKIDVDIAHRPGEMLVRFTIPERGSAAFLLERFEELERIIHEQGFERTELMTHVGKTTESIPGWTANTVRGIIV